QGAFGASSNLNVESAGQTIPNAVVVPVGSNGGVTLYTQSGGHLVADLLGYFQPAGVSNAGRFAALRPARVLDTRSGYGSTIGAQRVPTSTPLVLTVAGRGGVPPHGASAVVLNVTATEATAPGFVQVVPTGGPTPLGSSS